MVRSLLRRSTLLLSVVALLASLAAAPAAAAPPARQGSPFRHGRLLRGRRPAPGPGRGVRSPGPPADDGLVPQERDLGDRQRPADRGAAEHRCRLVQPGDRRLAGGHRLDQQHVPHQRRRRSPTGPPRSTPASSRPRSIAQSRRARRPQGRPGRVGRRPQRVDPRARRSTTGRSSPAAAWRPTSSARPATLFDDAPFIAAFGLQFDHPGRLRRPGALPGCRPDRRHRLDERPDLVQPGQGDAPARARLRRRQVRPQRLHLRQHQRRDDELRQGPVLEDEERRRRRRHARQGPVGRRQGHDLGRRPRRQDRRHAGQGRGADAPTCPASASSTPP